MRWLAVLILGLSHRAEHGMQSLDCVIDWEGMNPEFSGCVGDFGFVSPIPVNYDDRILEFNREFFFKDEPVSQMMGLYKPELYDDLDHVTKTILEFRLSVMAIHMPSKEVAAISLNDMHFKSDMNQQITSTNPVVKFSLLFHKIHEYLNLFDKYGLNKLFAIEMIAVNSNYRRNKLACHVVSKSENVAARNSAKAIVAEGTNLFSQKVFQQLDFETVWKCKYEDIQHADGRSWNLKPIPPNHELKYYLKMISPIDDLKSEQK